MIIAHLIDNATAGVMMGKPVEQKEIYILNQTFGYNDCLRPLEIAYADLLVRWKEKVDELAGLGTSSSDNVSIALDDSVMEVGRLLQEVRDQKVSIIILTYFVRADTDHQIQSARERALAQRKNLWASRLGD